jgi:hypothetical protein
MNYTICEQPFYYAKNSSIDESCSHTSQFYLTVIGSICAFLILISISTISLVRKRYKRKGKYIESTQLYNTKDPVYRGY